MSSIWKNFTILSDNKNKAKCESCKKDFACPRGTTSGLKTHLKSKHKEIFLKFEADYMSNNFNIVNWRSLHMCDIKLNYCIYSFIWLRCLYQTAPIQIIEFYGKSLANFLAFFHWFPMVITLPPQNAFEAL